MVRPEIEAVTPLSTSKTRLVPPPLMVTPRPDPGPSIASRPAVPARIRVVLSVIVCGVENTDGSNAISVPLELGLASAFASQVTYGSVPEVPDPANPPLVEFTV